MCELYKKTNNPSMQNLSQQIEGEDEILFNNIFQSRKFSDNEYSLFGNDFDDASIYSNSEYGKYPQSELNYTYFSTGPEPTNNSHNPQENQANSLELVLQNKTSIYLLSNELTSLIRQNKFFEAIYLLQTQNVMAFENLRIKLSLIKLYLFSLIPSGNSNNTEEVLINVYNELMNVESSSTATQKYELVLKLTRFPGLFQTRYYRLFKSEQYLKSINNLINIETEKNINKMINNFLVNSTENLNSCCNQDNLILDYIEYELSNVLLSYLENIEITDDFEEFIFNLNFKSINTCSSEELMNIEQQAVKFLNFDLATFIYNPKINQIYNVTKQEEMGQTQNLALNQLLKIENDISPFTSNNHLGIHGGSFGEENLFDNDIELYSNNDLQMLEKQSYAEVKKVKEIVQFTRKETLTTTLTTVKTNNDPHIYCCKPNKSVQFSQTEKKKLARKASIKSQKVILLNSKSLPNEVINEEDEDSEGIKEVSTTIIQSNNDMDLNNFSNLLKNRNSSETVGTFIINIHDEQFEKTRPMIENNKLSKVKNCKLSILKKFSFKYVKRENIDKKVIRNYKRFLEKKFAGENNLKDIGLSFIEGFIKSKYFPPCKIDVDLNFKSFNTSYMIWFFSNPSSVQFYSEFIEQCLLKCIEIVVSTFKVDDKLEIGLIRNYILSIAQIYSNFSSNEESQTKGSSDFANNAVGNVNESEINPGSFPIFNEGAKSQGLGNEFEGLKNESIFGNVNGQKNNLDDLCNAFEKYNVDLNFDLEY